MALGRCRSIENPKSEIENAVLAVPHVVAQA
jgi:hypothetical protein